MSTGKDSVGFGFLGVPYQKRLIGELVTDYSFASNIISIINPNYFTDPHLRIIATTIKDAHETEEVILDYDSLAYRLNNRSDNEATKMYLEAFLKEIKDLPIKDTEFIQDKSMKFCKQQELRKSVNEIQKIIDNGKLDDYDSCEEILKKALLVGNDKEFGIDVFFDIDNVLSENFRRPIKTGINGLDDKMNGGLSKGELAVILAPFGIGKTTLITKIANSAFNEGKNVLQIFFEDIPKVIQRKHLSCWSKIPLNDLALPEHRPLINEIITDKSKSKGYLELKKFPSDGTTIPMIKNYVRKLKSSGRKPDVILIDYIDCVASTSSFEKSYEGEGPIMRQFESLLSEFDMAGWTAVQGNRCVSLDTIIEDSKRGKIEIRNIKEGDEILTHKGYKKVTNVFPITKQLVYEIKLKSGKKIKVSKKHKFPTKDGRMLSIEDGLKIGDILLGKK